MYIHIYLIFDLSRTSHGQEDTTSARVQAVQNLGMRKQPADRSPPARGWASGSDAASVAAEYARADK